MSEEETEVIRTVCTVGLRPEATPKETPEVLRRMVTLLRHDAQVLREIVKLADEARDRLLGEPTDMNGLRAYECLELILSKATTAANEHDKATASGRKKNT